MWAKRIGALVIAVALVAVAFVIRDRRTDDGGQASPGSTTPGGTVPRDGLRLVCATELAAACAEPVDGVTATVADAGDTAAALAAADDPATVLDAWLTVAPWPELVDQRRAAANLAPAFGAAGTPLAVSPVGVAVRSERVEALAAACGGAVTLACVGEKGGESWADLGGQTNWQRLRPTLNDPTASATGLASLAAAVRDRRRDDATLTLDELRGDTAFIGWLARFEQGDVASGTPLARSVRIPQFDVVIVPQAEYSATRGASGVFTFTGATPYVAEVVLAGRSGADVAGDVGTALTGRLTAAGWTAGEATNRIAATLVAGMQVIWKETS